MNGNQVAELCILLACASAFALYIAWYFSGISLTVQLRGRRYQNLWMMGLEAREIWANAVIKGEQAWTSASMGVMHGC
jgi:hypothetical protein